MSTVIAPWLSALGSAAMQNPWEWMMHPGMMMGFGIFGMLFQLALLVLVVVVVWKLVEKAWGTSGGEDSAVRILRERYARGEIDQEEFERRKQDLETG